MNGKLILIVKYIYKTVNYNIMGMRNESRGMDNKAVMTFRELENGEWTVVNRAKLILKLFPRFRNNGTTYYVWGRD